VTDPQKSDPIRKILLASCIVAGFCILSGAAVRQLAIVLESPIAAELSNAILFAPCSLATIWIAWRTQATCKPSWLGMPLIAIGLILCFLARYQIALGANAGANSIAGPDVPGYCSSQSFWIAMQAAHWLVFLAAGALVAKVLQWSTGIGIWSIRSVSPDTAPGSLSLAKLLALTLLCAGLIAAYQRWILAWLPDLIGTESKLTWYQFFPVGSRPWVAGLLGGLLLPVHWFAIASILQLLGRNRHRNIPLCVVLLGAWCLVAGCLQAGCSSLYFYSMSPSWIPNGFWANWSENSWSGARWVEYSIGIPYNIPRYGLGSGGSAGTEQKQFWFYCLRGLVQTCIVTLAILGLNRLGLRAGFYRNSFYGNGFYGDRMKGSQR
jgi:hypothetical protein